MGLKKVTLVACIFAGSVSCAAALPCNLTEQDHESLANAGLKLTKADIERLNSRDQEMLCKARKFYHEARGVDSVLFGKTHSLKDIATGTSRLLTEAEYDEIRGALAEVMGNAAASR